MRKSCVIGTPIAFMIVARAALPHWQTVFLVDADDRFIAA
jgi:hypothetical protein